MHKLFPAALITIALLSGSAFAKDKDHGDRRKESSFHDRDNHRDHDRVRNHDRDHDRDRDHHRASSRPAGWDKGKKTGWGDCDVPPGQAKKSGCNDDRRRHTVAHNRTRHTDRHPRPATYRHHTQHAPVTTATTTTTTTTAATRPAPSSGRQTRTSR